MEEQYVSFETAKILKEIGFNVPCKEYYDYYKGNPVIGTCNMALNHNTECDCDISCPTQALAARWIREIHGIHVYALQTNLPATKPQTTVWEWGYMINKVDNPNEDSGCDCDMGYSSYEDALEAGLQEAIKRIKNVGRTE